MQGAFFILKNRKGGAYMAHIHEVKDAETHFIINATSREISNVAELPALVQHDHNSEVFTFVIPRYVDGHDMATCNKIRVHYINIDSATKERYADVYEVKDLKVDETDETKVVCTWTISRYATQYAGVLNFVLQYACEIDGVIDYSWNTAIFTGITVKNGINNAEQVVKDYSDVLEAWKKELEELAASGGGGGLKEVAWEDIKNKPFGELKPFDDVIYNGTSNIVVTESFSVPNFGDGFYYVKVGELPAPAMGYLSKLNVFLLNNGMLYNKDELENWNVFGENYSTILAVENIWFIVAVDKPNITVRDMTFKETGLYFLKNDSLGMWVKEAIFIEFVKFSEDYMPESYGTVKSDIEQLKEDVQNATPDDYEALKKDVETLKEADYIPNVTASEGDFLCFSGGEWSAKTVPNAEGAAF